jgi:hypothetical protein
MKRNDRRVLQQKSAQRDFLTPVSIRIQPEIWQKCGWAAAEVGLDRSAFVRNTLSYATRDVERPEGTKSREIKGSADEWEKWDGLSRQIDCPVPELVRRCLNGLVERYYKD